MASNKEEIKRNKDKYGKSKNLLNKTVALAAPTIENNKNAIQNECGIKPNNSPVQNPFL